MALSNIYTRLGRTPVLNIVSLPSGRRLFIHNIGDGEVDFLAGCGGDIEYGRAFVRKRPGIAGAVWKEESEEMSC